MEPVGLGSFAFLTLSFSLARWIAYVQAVKDLPRSRVHLVIIYSRIVSRANPDWLLIVRVVRLRLFGRLNGKARA